MIPTVRPVAPSFWRLDAQIGWRTSATNSTQIFDDAQLGGLRLGDEYATAILPTEPSGTFGGVTRPTGLAVGPDGRLFLADPGHHRILTYTTHEGAFVPLWDARTTSPPDPYTLRKPRGIAISHDGDLVIADSAHSRVIVYTWPGLAVRHILRIPGGEPWDLAYDARGHLYVADAARKRIHRFDRLWRRDPDYDGGAGALVRPKHLAFDAEGVLFVLDESPRQIVALDPRGHPMPETDGALFARGFPPALTLDEEGLWLPQADRPNCPALFLVGLDVNRRGWLAGTTLPLLARPSGVTYPRSGRYVSKALDSEIYDCAWHRLVLDADVPEGALLAVRTLTAPTKLEDARVASLPDDRWSPELIIGPNDWTEVLIQSQPGRYLWLTVELNGNGQVTPLIRAMVLYAPRASSLAYLPPVFREDAVSADFLDRFLSYFDTVFAEIESQVDRFTGYLDPDGVPSGEFLTWLGSWFDLKFLAQWTDATRRAFVRRAIELYRLRGTVRGLQEILRLHTGLRAPQPVIVEHFRLRDYEARHAQIDSLVAGTPYLAGRSLMPGEGEFAHHFTLALPNQVVPDAEALATIRHLLDVQKPAHTHYEIRVVAPGVRIGCQSTIGVDTVVGSYPGAPLGGLKLAQSGRLAAGPPRLGTQRLGF